jgi:hypothetical protein
MIALALNSCKAKPENNIARSLQLFKKGGDLMTAGFKLEVAGSDSSNQYYRQAIDLFLSSYRLDTSNYELAIYLPDLYNKINKPDSAIFWQSKFHPTTVR